MKVRTLFLVTILLLSVILVRADEDMGLNVSKENFTYLIGPGDVLNITVWRHADLTTEARVRPDGMISFPLAEEVSALNRTPLDLKRQIEEKISWCINEPRVTVNVKSFKSKKIFVLGQVNRPGVYPFEGRMTVVDAIGKAFGYVDGTANLKSVIIVRRGYSTEPEPMRVNISDVIHKGHVRKDIMLEPGDIVYVPKSFIANVNTFINQLFTKTSPVLKYYLDIIDIDQRTPSGRSR